MKNRNSKLRKSGGFTLVEMLVVVGIIAILVAVSIPLISNALERARDSTDMANERACKAVAAMVYMEVAEPVNKNILPGAADAPRNTGLYIYDAPGGQLWWCSAPDNDSKINMSASTGGTIHSARVPANGWQGLDRSTIPYYGKCTGNNCVADYANGGKGHEDHCIFCFIDYDGTIYIRWGAPNNRDNPVEWYLA